MVAPRNTPLIPGVSALSRSQSYKAKGQFNRKKKVVAKKPVAALTKTVPVKGDKNGKARVVSVVPASKYVIISSFS
jgi:hypothetical protein